MSVDRGPRREPNGGDTPMKTILLLPFAALSLGMLALGACAPKPAANTATISAINGPADCAAGGLAPGSQAYQDCVNSLANVNTAAISGDAAQMRAQIQQQMAQQQAQMNQTMQNPASGCTTTRDANNNVTTQCP
jgi:hypothetical protein